MLRELFVYFSNVLTLVDLFPFLETFPIAQTVNLSKIFNSHFVPNEQPGLGAKCDSSPLTDFLFTNLYFQK